MGLKTLSIGKTRIVLVGNYKYSKKLNIVDKFLWKGWKLGLWFKTSKIVGTKHASQIKEWNNNLVNGYMLGIDLLLVRGWIAWDRGGLHIELKKEKK